MRELLILLGGFALLLAIIYILLESRVRPPALAPADPPAAPPCAPSAEGGAFCLVPVIPDAGMLFPFRECPSDELDEAWRAMLAIVAARHAGCYPQFDHPVRYRLLEDPVDSYLPACRPMREGGAS